MFGTSRRLFLVVLLQFSEHYFSVPARNSSPAPSWHLRSHRQGPGYFLAFFLAAFFGAFLAAAFFLATVHSP
jgi:hypothetical protein